MCALTFKVFKGVHLLFIYTFALSLTYYLRINDNIEFSLNYHRQI